MREARAAPAIVWATDQARYAVALAARLRAHRGRGQAWVECWMESPGVRGWKRLPDPQPAVATSDGQEPAPEKKFASGEVVDAVLLPEAASHNGRKSRKARAARKAQIVGCDLTGPITNSSELPAELLAGQVVRLRIGAIDGAQTRVQFHWSQKA